MKVALCFLISSNNTVNKEHIWREWIEKYKNVFNIYFHYKQTIPIQSEWIKKHILPPEYIVNTSYLHVVPAYISILKYAIQNDVQNKWFVFLTESCVPIIPPKKFIRMFIKNYKYSIINWSSIWWNPLFHKRANLHKVPEEFHLANDPWFILKRDDAIKCVQYSTSSITLSSYKLITSGIIANESIFAIILKTFGTIDNAKCQITHLTDWSRMETTTSPHLFKTYDENVDGYIINKLVKNNPSACFLRKVSPEFPDDVLKKWISSKERKQSYFNRLVGFLWELWDFIYLIFYKFLPK